MLVTKAAERKPKSVSRLERLELERKAQRLLGC